MFTIYRIINKINGHSYVGFTQQSADKRFHEHHNHAKRSDLQSHLYRAMRKYGIENFISDVLEEGWEPKIGLEIREPYWISVLKPEYNMTSGGDGILGYRHTEITRAEARERQIGVSPTAEVRKAISETLKLRYKNTPRTAEHRAALSAAKKGVPLSPQHRKALIGVKKTKVGM